MKKAVILLSGGLDSTTLLYHARAKGFKPYALIFDYGQRHRREIGNAKRIARRAKCPFQVMTIALPWRGSALLDRKAALPKSGRVKKNHIPSTYVPARNIIFLSFAVSYAEAVGARAVFIGANAIDYSGYPDCRPAFFRAWQKVLRAGLKSGVDGKMIKVHAPLVRMSKAQIIRLGLKLNVPYAMTWSCYRGGRKPCGTCDSCRLRRKGFAEVQIKDPL